MTSRRYFTVTKSSTGFTGGRFRGELPSIAAKNAARRVLGDRGTNATFTITETARSIPRDQRGSFSYSCQKVKLPTPKKIKVPGGGPEIIQTHRYVVKPKGKVNSKAAMSGGASYGGFEGYNDYDDYPAEGDYSNYNNDNFDDTESQA